MFGVLNTLVCYCFLLMVHFLTDIEGFTGPPLPLARPPSYELSSYQLPYQYPPAVPDDFGLWEINKNPASTVGGEATWINNAVQPESGLVHTLLSMIGSLLKYFLPSSIRYLFGWQ